MGNKHKNNDSNKHETIDSNYFPKNGYLVAEHRLEPIARVLLIGVYDDNHSLSTFRGMRYIIKIIWELTIQFNKHHYSSCIEIKDDPELGIINSFRSAQAQKHGHSVAFMQIVQPQLCHYSPNSVGYASLAFPKALKKEININMMPLKMELSELKEQIPNILHGYIPFIHACLAADPSQKGTICFLTIHESYVAKGRTQRRPGLHIELPGKGIGGESNWFHGWGGGYLKRDGIFIASNVSDTCAVWNCRIIERESEEQAVKVMDAMGGLEHIRTLMPTANRYSLEKDKLYWITDRTPHEALPMKKSDWRQFFRLVSHKLGAWYKDHSTKNPLGVLPDKSITTIIKGSKFARKQLQ